MNSLAMARYLGPYKAAAAEGAVLELKMRILAYKVPQLRKFAHDQKLQNVENALVQHYGDAITEEEKHTLQRCRCLRNKILHCDFPAARGVLGDLGANISSAKVRQIDVRNLSSQEMREKAERAIAGEEGTFQHVSEAKDSADNIYAWLLETGESGDFDEAVRVFAEAAAIVDRLAERPS
jgi:hypothetical protein